MSKSAGILIFKKNKEVFDNLTDEQAGQLIKAIFDYDATGELPNLDGLLKVVFLQIRHELDDQSQRYDEICQKRKEAANARWRSQREKEDAEIINAEMEKWLGREAKPREQDFIFSKIEEDGAAFVFAMIEKVIESGGHTFKYLEETVRNHEQRGYVNIFRSKSIKDVIEKGG